LRGRLLMLMEIFGGILFNWQCINWYKWCT
jgi:hypothetical protein